MFRATSALAIVALLALAMSGCGAVDHHKNLVALQAEFGEYRKGAEADRERKTEALAIASSELREMRKKADEVDSILEQLLAELGESIREVYASLTAER